jgi:hypothetical protein
MNSNNIIIISTRFSISSFRSISISRSISSGAKLQDSFSHLLFSQLSDLPPLPLSFPPLYTTSPSLSPRAPPPNSPQRPHPQPHPPHRPQQFVWSLLLPCPLLRLSVRRAILLLILRGSPPYALGRYPPCLRRSAWLGTGVVVVLVAVVGVVMAASMSVAMLRLVSSLLEVLLVATVRVVAAVVLASATALAPLSASRRPPACRRLPLRPPRP